MNKALLFATLFLAPAIAPAATIVVEGGGPYDVTSDTLFSGIAISFTGGAGSYTIDFFTPGAVAGAVADAAVTSAAISTLFTDLTMSWIDGETLNTLVQAPGIDTISTIFSGAFPTQQLVFSWSDSVQLAGFGFDVSTETASMPQPIPLPASVLLLGAALGGLGVLGRRRTEA